MCAMEIVKQAGAQIAFPSQTMYIRRGSQVASRQQQISVKRETLNPGRLHVLGFARVVPFDSTTDKIITGKNPGHSGTELTPGICL